MGLDWINIFLLIYVNRDNNIIIFIFTYINLCPGYFIFLIFVYCDDNVISALRKRFPRIMNACSCIKSYARFWILIFSRNDLLSVILIKPKIRHIFLGGLLLFQLLYCFSSTHAELIIYGKWRWKLKTLEWNNIWIKAM